MSFIDRCIAVLVKKSNDSNTAIRDRALIIQSICNAMMAIDPVLLPKLLHVFDDPSFGHVETPLAAIVGDLPMLWKNIGLSALLTTRHGLLPNALDAAVAAGQIDALKFMLEWMSFNVQGRQESGSWAEMRRAARAIGGALLTAIRLRKTDAGHALLSFFASHSEYKDSIGSLLKEYMIQDCIRYDNDRLICGVVILKYSETHGRYATSNHTNLTISPSDEAFLFKHGHPSAFHALLKHGLYDLNRCGQTSLQLPSLLYSQLSSRGYKMAMMLLAHRVKLGAVSSKGYTQITLWYAVHYDRSAKVKAYLRRGAQPSLGVKDMNHDLASPVHHKKSLFLLSKVKKYGKDFLNRPDLWRIYQWEVAHGTFEYDHK